MFGDICSQFRFVPKTTSPQLISIADTSSADLSDPCPDAIRLIPMDGPVWTFCTLYLLMTHPQRTADAAETSFSLIRQGRNAEITKPFRQVPRQWQMMEYVLVKCTGRNCWQNRFIGAVYFISAASTLGSSLSVSSQYVYFIPNLIISTSVY